MDEFIFNLGDEVKDKVTGFKGIVRARVQYLTGCNTYGLQNPKLNKEGVPRDWKYFDEPQLTLVKAGKVTLHEDKKTQPGPPRRKGGPLSLDQYPPS